jgi:hypothetical protein
VSYVSTGVFAERGHKVYGGGFGQPDSRLARRFNRLRPCLASIPRRLPQLAETSVALKAVE